MSHNAIIKFIELQDLDNHCSQSCSASNCPYCIYYSGYSGCLVAVNETETGIRFIPNPSSSRTIIRSYLNDSDQSINDDIWTKIQFNSINYDALSEFDYITNYRFTATSNGYYQVNTRVKFTFDNSNANDYCSISIYKNGSVYAYGNNLGIDIINVLGLLNLRTNNAPNISDVIPLNINDYIEIYCYQNTGSSAVIKKGSEETYVSIYKIN